MSLGVRPPAHASYGINHHYLEFIIFCAEAGRTLTPQQVAFYFSALNAIFLGIHLFRIRKRPHAIGMATVTFAIHAAIILEVMEFTPLGGVLDAHAAWHIATSPLNFFIYWYQVEDLLWDCYEKCLYEKMASFQLNKKKARGDAMCEWRNGKRKGA